MMVVDCRLCCGVVVFFVTVFFEPKGAIQSGGIKSTIHKGDGQWWIGAIQHNLSHSVQWAISQKIALKDEISIYGDWYGVYACLVGLTFSPKLYKCGVDIVRPSNLKTLLDSIPTYQGPLRNDMLKKIGDVD